MAAYAEWHVTSNFSFLEGGSHAEELAAQASALGLAGIGVADRNTLAGVVRAHLTAKNLQMPFRTGCRLVFRDGKELLCYPSDRAAYGRLSRLLTLGRRRAEKGDCYLDLGDAAAEADGQIVIALGEDADFLRKIRDIYGDRAYLAAQMLGRGDDRRRLGRLQALSAETGLGLIATNDVRYHVPERRRLQDVLTAIREGCTVQAAGRRLLANAERHLKTPDEMARLFAEAPDAVARTLEILERVTFSLDELAYEYPDEIAIPGETTQKTLERLTWAGAETRYGKVLPDKVRGLIEHELALIAELNYAPYFLTVHDIVRFARMKGILCQGRGSAANSAVCYCLGVTSVDPSTMDLLFERFVSAERNEPPDIDVDFEHERREEVIQYIYGKYGRDRAGLAATVISYRSKSAIREVGKALGLSLDAVDAMTKTIWREGLQENRIAEAGLDPDDPTVAEALRLARELHGFPRHLSQHVGGFVISRGPLSELVPIENAAMADRTVIQWDKDDLQALGLMKVDVLGLGMLSCIAKAFRLLEERYDRPMELASVPPEDPAVYDMLCEADSVGVFQVESRAQMTMLPRLKPREFYDLVIEVAIVRPGPIQGDMVHPYLRRRNGEEPVEFPSEELRGVLGKTMGVPLFQEQAMKIAIVAAGFTPAESDKLRRAMATFRKVGTIHSFNVKLVEGMVERGYDREFAERCFKQIEGFGEYGFPESHAASFALLVYVSAWLKKHYPDVFCAAILNSQPMGFYAPAQLVRDARDHGVEVRPVDVNHSDPDHLLEPLLAPDPKTGLKTAVRLGFRIVKGLKADAAARIALARPAGGYRTVQELARRAELDTATLKVLADADAFGTLGLTRRQALWAARAVEPEPLPLFAAAEARADAAGHNRPFDLIAEPEVELPEMGVGEEVVADYQRLKLTLRSHPCALLRERLSAHGAVLSEVLPDIPNNRRIVVAGLVLVRQRPGSAKGVIFTTLEDETGVANVIVWPHVFERFRRTVLTSRLLGVRGKLQREGKVIHIVADRVFDLSAELALLTDGEAPEDFAAGAIANADEVVRPQGPRKRLGETGIEVEATARADMMRHSQERSRRRDPLPAWRRADGDPANAAMPKGRNFR
ncbi:MAG: error-prone DNA polymerase [Minwuia sp.]|uniref:error-prone DNA polymerase n=1 Tax=Minwuia sp. TaxID=2493630 RepID=UPI003A899AF6